MFGKKENDVKPATRILSNSSNITYLAEDSEMKGSFVANGNARIDGKFEGTILVGGSLVVGQTAVLKANIEAQNISVAGEIRGNVKVRELLELSSSARLYGDIFTKELKIDTGARFIGKSVFEESAAAGEATNKVISVPLANEADEANEKEDEE